MTGIDTSALTAGSLLLLLVLVVVTGFLSGKVLSAKTANARFDGYEKQVIRERAAHDAEVERVRLFHTDEMARSRSDTQDWREVARAKDAVISEQTMQISALLEGARTTHAVIRAIPGGSASREGDGDERSSRRQSGR